MATLRFAHTSQVHSGTVVILNGADRLVVTRTPVINGAWGLDVTFADGGTARLTDNVTVRR